MAYSKKTYEEIYESMAKDLRERLPELTDFEQGSVVRSLLETIAFEQKVFYEQLDYVYNASFVNTASTVNLEKVVAILDVYRNEPDYATGLVTFYKEEGYEEEVTIPVGTLVVTEDDPNQAPARKAYLTISQGHMPPGITEVTVKVQAEQRGKHMATAAQTLIVLQRPIAGVQSVTNLEAISFIGRERETDPELRERAKKTLLSAGRASHTSIAQALLALPKILDVKILEPQATPGVIDVYVDGLTQDNSKALRERLDEVRAAGIYARLKPAERVEVHCTFKLLPHEEVISDEIASLENSVQQALINYVRQLGMGDTLSTTRLTTEILNIRGVQDVEHYEILLVPSPPRPVPEASFDESQPQGGSDTGERSTTTRPVIGFYIGQNEQGEDLYQEPADAKRLFFSEVSRFAPTRIRIAAEDKQLPVQIHIKLKYLNAQSIANVQSKVQTTMAGLAFTQAELDLASLSISTALANSYLNQLNALLARHGEEIKAKVAELRADPIAEAKEAVNTYLLEASGLAPGAEDPVVAGYYSLTEGNIKTALHNLLKEEGDRLSMVKLGLRQLLNEQASQAEQGFPMSQLSTDLLNEVVGELRDQLDTERQRMLQNNQQLSTRQSNLATDDSLSPGAKQNLKNEIAALQTAIVANQTKIDALQSDISGLNYQVQQLLSRWQELLVQKITKLQQSKTINQWVGAISKETDFDLSLRLRAVDYLGHETYHSPIPVGFVERPTLDYIWVYSKDLRLAGTLTIDLPANTSDRVQNEQREAAREAIAQALYNQRPEEDIVLGQIIEVVSALPGILGARFTDEAPGLVEDQASAYKLLPDRLQEEALLVMASERVLLSDQYFTVKS